MSNEDSKMPREELLVLWTTYSGYCEEVTNKRQVINTFFLAIISAIIGFITGMWGALGLVLSIIGFLISIFWGIYISSYKKLNAAKFDVLLGIEEELGLSVYSLEWKKAKENKYIKLTTVELCLVAIFTFGFIALFVISIIKLIGFM